MKITVIAVGKIKEKYLKDGIAEYSKRLSRFCELEVIEVGDEQAPDTLSDAGEVLIKKKEAEKIKKRLKDTSFKVVLDIKGKKFDSESLSKEVNSYLVSGVSHITFIIGGSLGLSEELLTEADLRLSFSDLTFPHQLVRLMLMEQIYRVFKIMGGETYHK